MRASAPLAPVRTSLLVDITDRVTVLLLHGRADNVRSSVEQILHDDLLAQPWLADNGADCEQREGERDPTPPVCLLVCALAAGARDPVERLGDLVCRAVPSSEALDACADVPVLYATAAFAAALAPELGLPHQQLRLAASCSLDLAGLRVPLLWVAGPQALAHRDRMRAVALSDTHQVFRQLADHVGIWPAVGSRPIGNLPGALLYPSCRCGGEFARSAREFLCPACGARSL